MFICDTQYALKLKTMRNHIFPFPKYVYRIYQACTLCIKMKQNYVIIQRKQNITMFNTYKKIYKISESQP
jgi:hypothetical protein